MPGAEEVGPEIHPIVAAVVDSEGKVLDLEPVAQRSSVHEVAVHVVRGDTIFKHRRTIHLVEPGVRAVGVKYRGQAVPLTGDPLLPFAYFHFSVCAHLDVPLRCIAKTGLDSLTHLGAEQLVDTSPNRVDLRAEDGRSIGSVASGE